MRSERVAAVAVGAAFGPSAARLIAVVILVSMFSAANGLTSRRRDSTPWRDGVFKRLGEVHRVRDAGLRGARRFPAMLLAMTGTLEQLLTYVVFAGWILWPGRDEHLRLRRRSHGKPSTFCVPGYPVTPAVRARAPASC